MSEQALDKDINNISFEKNNIQELIDSISRRKKIAIILGGIIFAIGSLKTTYERIFNPTYMSNFTLLISDPITSSSDEKNSSNLFIEDLAVNQLNTDFPTLVEYLRSHYVLNKVASEFNKSSNDIRANLVIEKGGKNVRQNHEGEGIIRVKYYNKNKRTSLRVIEYLSNHYLNISLKDPQQKLLDGLDFLNKQEPILREKYSFVQNQIVDFRQKNKLIEPSLEGGAIRNKQQALQNRVIELYSYKERLENIKNKLSEGQIVTNRFQEIFGGKTYPGDDLIISDFDQKLLNELLLVESELAKAKSKFTPNSSIVKSLTSRIEQIQPQLVESQMEIIETALILNRSEIKSTEKQIKELEILFSTKPELIKQYNSLDQRLKIASDNLAGLVSARENFLLKIAQNSIKWKLLEPPSLYPYPVSPSFKKGILLSLISAIFLGSLSALIRDKLDNIFHSPDEVEKELNKSNLTHIPFINLFDNLRRSKASLLEVLNINSSIEGKEEKRQRFFFQEALRNLFTSIRYLSSDNSLKTISITSSVPEEGKSLINCLLAITMSELNQKVLLIDADLRKPQIHKRFNIDNINGLSNYLIEENSTLNSIIQKVDEFPNLSIIPSGIMPPDSTRLLSSKKFEKLIESLNTSNNYDYIIIDTTPILGLADAVLISKIIDGVILLVSINGTNKENAKRSIKRIEETGSNFLGIMSNSIKEDKLTQKGYYGYKYQKYGYGYSNYSTYEIYDKYSNNEQDSTNELENPKKDDNGNEDSSHNNFTKKLINKFLDKFKNFMRWLDS